MKPATNRSGEFKTAVIVAAGRSTRLHPLTLTKPKGLLEINGEMLLARSLRILREAGIERIAMVVGFEHQQIRNALGEQCRFIANPYFPLCNNMGSLWFAKDFVADEPFVYLHGDLIYEAAILKTALSEAKAQPEDEMSLVTDFGPVDEEAMKVRITSANLLIESNKEIPLHEAAGEWTGIALVRCVRRVFTVIEEKLLAGEYDRYDTSAFTRMAGEGTRIVCSPTHGLKWKEIDFATDLEEARRLFEGSSL